MSGKKGADWFEESDRDKMNMLDSCRRGNLAEVAKFLSSGVDVDEEDDDGVTALQIAAAKGHRSLAEFLIRKCASLDLANYAGMTPFLHACREGHQDIVTLLANHGTNIHATTGLGVSAMALACAGRHLPVVRTLKGLNVSLDLKQQQQGRCPHQIPPSPYMVAFFQMDIQICGFLKQQNANLWQQVRSLDGLDISRLGQLLGLPEMLMRLNHSTEHTLRVQREEHKNDLRLVVQRGDELMLVQMLQDGQVPVALQDGLSPLMFAAVAGQTRIADLLLRSGRGGAVDAQENVLGMTALMFAIVAGESPVVQLLLRQGANPRILSTTREPFSALDLALFSEISRDSLKQLCAQWLAKGGNKEAAAALVVGGGKETPRPRSDSTAAAEQQQQLQVASRDSTTGRGAITPARLRRALESIGKNLGLAGDEMPSWALMGEMGMQQSGADLEGRPRLEWAALDSALLDGQPRAFVLAEHILRGDSRPPGPKKAGADSLVLVARQIAISWMSKGHALRPIPTAGGQKAFEAEEREADGLYSAAQRNADRELRKARHQRYQPSRKSSRTPMTPKVMRAAQQQPPKSPSLIDPQRTMRKAPLRLGHYRASSGGSQTPSAAESPRISGSSSASVLLNPQPPRFPQPLTKELVQSKLHEWKLADQFHEYFAAEEVDELSFASLREEEVRQVLARRKPAGDGSTGQQQELCQRFAGLIREIKRCTASSELL